MDNFNNLTPAELERLSLLSKELGAAVNIIGNILCHGYESCNPLKEDKITNRRLLQKELGHIQNAVNLLVYQGDLSQEEILDSAEEKMMTFGKWLHHQNN